MQISLPPLAQETAMRFLTWNLRYDSLADTIPLTDSVSSLPASLPADESVSFYSSPHEVPWSTRRIDVAREVLFHAAVIVGFQEALVRQVGDLAQLLGNGFSWIGSGREDGGTTGEYEAIFYRNDLVQLDSWDTMWLSETPFTPSKFPGAGSTRTATYARMRMKDSGSSFTVVCTHWDEQSDPQRQLSASLLVRLGASSLPYGPVFVLGDFNSPSTGSDCTGYRIMTGLLPPVAVPSSFADRFPVRDTDAEFVFTDVAQVTPPLGRSGHHGTFTGFEEHAQMDLKRIDFVMAGGKGWEPLRYRVGENWHDNSAVASDHRPVFVDVILSSAN